MFLLSAGSTVGFAIGYVLIHLKSVDSALTSNLVLGLTLAGALTFIGIGMVLWTKLILPHYDEAEERHPLTTSEEDRQEFAEVFNRGLDEMAIVRRPILRRSLLTAGALLGVLPLFRSATSARCRTRRCVARAGRRTRGSSTSSASNRCRSATSRSAA